VQLLIGSQLINQKQRLPHKTMIGSAMELSLQLRIKETVVHAGPSQQLALCNLIGIFLEKVEMLPFQNNN
jgi:hypothetical protein